MTNTVSHCRGCCHCSAHILSAPSRSPVTLVDISWKNSKLLTSSLGAFSVGGLSAPGVDLCSGSARSAGQLISQGQLSPSREYRLWIITLLSFLALCWRIPRKISFPVSLYHSHMFPGIIFQINYLKSLSQSLLWGKPKQRYSILIPTQRER